MSGFRLLLDHPVQLELVTLYTYTNSEYNQHLASGIVLTGVSEAVVDIPFTSLSLKS